MKTLDEIETTMLCSYIRLTQGNINTLIKRDKQMAKYFQEDLDTLQKDTGITDEMLYARRVNEIESAYNQQENGNTTKSH